MLAQSRIKRNSASPARNERRSNLILSAAKLAHTEVLGSPRDRPRLRYQIFVNATGRNAELRKAIPISKRHRGEPRVVMSLPLRGQKRGSPLLKAGDMLRVGVELEVTVDGETKAESYREPYSYSPRVAVELLLTRDRGAVKADGKKAVRLARRRPRTVGHSRHHYIAVIDAQRSQIGPRIARWDTSYVNVVASAWHPEAGRDQVLLIGENEPRGAPPAGDRGRINAMRFRPQKPRRPRRRATHAQTTHIPLVKGRRNLIYSLRLDELKAGEQLWFAAEVLTRSELDFPVRISAEIFMAKRPTTTRGPGKEVVRLCEFRGQVAKFNGFDCLPGENARTRKVGAMRLRREPDGPLYANLVATCSDPFHRGRGDESLKVVDGYLQAQRYPARWTG
jgi:hypothetical protein